MRLKDEYKNKIYSRDFFNITEYYLDENNYTNNTSFRVNYTNKTFSDPRNFSMFHEGRPLLVLEFVQVPQLLSMPKDIRLIFFVNLLNLNIFFKKKIEENMSL